MRSKPGPIRRCSMTWIQPRSKPAAVLFDVDGTLYTNEAFLREQTDVLVERLATYLEVACEEAEWRVKEAKAQYLKRTGEPASLSIAFRELGIDFDTSVAWRTELIKPEGRLAADYRLVPLIRAIAQRTPVAVITNNPVAIAQRTLDVLGLRRAFPVVVGLDTTMRSKPHWDIFQAALDALGADADATVMVGDRYGVDLAPIVVRGGGGFLVQSRQDLYDACARIGAWLDA